VEKENEVLSSPVVRKKENRKKEGADSFHLSGKGKKKKKKKKERRCRRHRWQKFEKKGGSPAKKGEQSSNHGFRGEPETTGGLAEIGEKKDRLSYMADQGENRGKNPREEGTPV